jgi:hypothetical protein
MPFWKPKQHLVVVLATRHTHAPPALEEAAAHLEDVNLERREALSVEGAYQELQGAHLAIVDLSDLAGAEADRERLESALHSPNLLHMDGQTLVMDPVAALEQAVAQAGLGSMLPPRSVAFTAWAGGVGKTTLALASALAFHRETGLPTAVIELAPGPSALQAVTGVEGATLYQVVTQGGVYPTWEGLTLGLMDGSTAELLAPDQIVAHWQQVHAEHIYVAYDAGAWHPLMEYVNAERIYVLADDRPDAQVEAVKLAQDLRSQVEGQVALGLNRAGLAGRVSLPEKPAFSLKKVRNPLNGKVGQQVLQSVYPGWRG